MKRKFLAALLALVMVFSMIPVSASAAGNVIVTGDDPITDNDRSVSFHLYTTQLYKLIMLEDNSATADSDVSGVSLLLYNGFGVLDRTELSLRKIGATKAETDYFEYSDTNRGHALEPNNIEGLKISYSTGDSQKEITIDASKLLLHCKRGALGLTADYTIMSSNTDKSIVAFYDNGGNAQQVAYSLWDAYIVETNSTLGDTNWPKDPDYIGESYTFFGWDEYKGGGKPFSQASVVTGDTQVFSQKTTTTGEHSGLHIHVMNRENTLKNRFVELYNATNNDSITISNVNWGTTQITLVGNNGEKSNPQYNLGATPNQWGKDDEYYWVQNPDADEETFGTPQYNKHIPPDAIVAIEVAADTVQSEKYVEEYSTDYGPHELYADSEPAITVKFIYSDEKWEIPADSKLPVFFVTCAESGEEQPTPPTPEEVIALMGDNAIEVACKTEGSGHNPSSYRLIPGSFDVGKVTKGEDGKYSCVITIDEDGILQYVDAYSQTVDYEHRTGIYRGPITFTITHDGTKWLQPSQLPAATITVVCEADQEDELDEDDLNEILGGAITVQCVSEEDHGYKTLTLYELLENASLGDASLKNIYSFIKNADGTYTVTLDGEKFASAYGTYVSDKIGKGENIPHQLVNEENADFEIRLTYDGIKWTFDPDPIVIEVTCEDDSGDEPTPEPDPDPEPDPNPDPDPDPAPTPTPDPGDDDNPPYIPPVDPDDSGVSDLLNTDDHIQYLFGYPEGTFGPENNMTRAEVAQMFYNLLLDQDVTITKAFGDVPANAWYAKAVNTLASLGVVSGVGNGDFEPERSITRAEFTSIAMKFAEGKTGGTNIFSDVKSTDWFYRAVVNSTQYGCCLLYTSRCV